MHSRDPCAGESLTEEDFFNTIRVSPELMRTGALMNARHEMHQHRRISKTEGIAPQDIDAACAAPTSI